MRRAVAAAAALVWLPAEAVSLKLVELVPPAGGSTAYAISDLGQVVGSIDAGARGHAFSWTAGGGLLDLHDGASTPGTGSVALAVNNLGAVAIVGEALTRASIWKNGSRRALPSWSSTVDSMLVMGLNDAGTAVGYGLAGSGTIAWRALPGQNPAPLPGTQSLAFAINQAGQAVGEVRNGAARQAALWSLTSAAPQTLAGMDSARALNNRGQVVGTAGDAQGRLLGMVWSASTGAVGLGSLGGRETRPTGINDAGQVVGTSTDAVGAVHGFLWTARTGMMDIDSLLSPGTTEQMLDVKAVNALGQMVGLTQSGRPVMLTASGDLAWQGSTGGSFNDGSNWELGFAPSYLVDAQLHTTGIQVVTMASNATVNSLGLGSASPGDGRPSLVLQDGAMLSAAYGVTVRSTGTLTGDGRVAGAVVNQGTVLAYNLRIDGGLGNQGQIVTINGLPGRLTTNLDNQSGGEIRISSGQALVLTGERHQNTGVLRLQGGEFEAHGAFANERGGRIFVNGGTLRLGDGLVNRGQLGISFGGAEIVGPILGLSGGVVTLSGRSNTTFYDEVDIAAGSELRVSGDATAVFFGRVQQRAGALFSGTGTKFYEGGFSVDAAPALGVDEGSVVFGHGNSYLAEIGGTAAGSGFDQLVVGGALKFGGTLKLASWSGFLGQAGQRYDLFDWASSSGSFDAIDASGLQLAEGLTLDTSRLYVDGSVTVTAVPEPGALALMLAGLAAVAGVARRRGVAG